MATDLTTIMTTGIESFAVQYDIKDDMLKDRTLKIATYMYAAKKSLFNIAVILNEIKTTGMAQNSGFKDVFEYASKVFGYKKNMVYQMCKVADKWLISVEGDSNSEVHSILATTASDGNTVDFTVSQLQELNVLENEDAVELVHNNVINPDMPTKAIRQKVKAFTEGEIDVNGQKTETSETANEDEDKDEDETDTETAETAETANTGATLDKAASALQDILNGIDVLAEDERISEKDKKWFFSVKKRFDSIFDNL